MVPRVNHLIVSLIYIGSSFCLFSEPVLDQTATVVGKVTDSETGQSLIGANVLVAGTSIGSATDIEGNFEISNLHAGIHILRASFIGYSAQELTVTLAEGENYVWNVALDPGTDLDPVQVTAGRQNEKTLNAPSSIDVITSRDFQLDVAQTTAKSLRNVTGLDMVQTGVDRYEIVLRGFNDAFSRSTHVLTDYRKAAVASIGVNLHNVMPSLAIDMERIEVVRGPGSALYGPGVDSGVIHYISKDAFNYPGATISVSGGQRSMLNVQGRVATVLGTNLGVKVIGSYATSEDFTLEGCDAALLKNERFSECPDPEDAVQLFVDGVRETKNRKLVLSSTVDLRLGKSTTLSLSAGIGNLDGAMLSSLGTIQAKGMVASYAQIRLSSGPLFVQAYMNSINSGNSYIYGGDPIQEYSEEYSVQSQYTQEIGSRQQLIAGVDLRFDRPDTRGIVPTHGEGIAGLDEYGAYLQSNTQISNRLKLTLALRGDINNIVPDLHLSPRVALVLKPTPSSSLRATYNRSLSSPLSTDYLLNLVVASIGPLTVRARGGATGFTFERNPNYLELGAPTSLVASSMLPGMEGYPTPVGIDTGFLYGLIYDGLTKIPDDELARMLAEAGLSIPLQLLPLLKRELNPEVTPVQGFSSGILGLVNLSTLELKFNSELNNLQDTEPIKPTTTQSWEIGYKGIIRDQILFTLDGYYGRRKNFTGPLQIKTPFVLVPNLKQDLIQDISAGLAANSDIANALRLVGLTPQLAAEILVNIAGGDLPDNETPVAIVQPNENNNGVGNFPELMLTFPNFGNIRYFGMDVSTQIIASEKLMFFGNASWVSDDYFDHTEINEESEDLELALNAPGFKFKIGGQYQRKNGFSFMASGRFTKGFPVISGQYVGNVPSYTVLDVGIGYAIHKAGFRADLGINNLFNSDHREFVGAPRLGRIAIIRLTYTTDRSG
ncbi:MAG: TonB-dependent receptor [Bacteroidetes bacterium]|nr:TonB-dependent receptor [Bacteroidota bacterium]